MKTKARMLIPVVRALESELGKEKAHALVGHTRAYFRSIGEPEIGALMTCGVDFAVNAIRPSSELTRSQT